MPRTSLTRRVTFAAAHRYRRPDWSDQENAEVFGACAHPHYHGHTYVCDVTVAGPVDEETGFLVDLGFLDHVLQREVRDRFDHRNINLDVPEFADGKMIPTGELLSRFICERVQAALAHTTARVIKVHLAEDATLSSCYEVDA
ncbi:6-carboxytetrahydropterin synthase [Gemmatimonas sp.]|jgi:6-pyruvoyltetrahydropterin/6-carboxytetrahydropterin synthase|uniref:6-pyruvoyl trahydropterin synthase family protein n=1 Tax=Gemmatimonas sp. TaxID=1962908 RepID=UPI0022C0507C|nr:6-carboxytetrahydropterin synthase [Gemmatimonas sp.]MCA2985571.1 6-carboxytetrahydropterin synthase [Gemmatimonas sp.]MCA2987766.1 6-carboxytetrahydropterin synthase [Gemmatimonas sp.]MCA2990166.1 6-carboxytetrahydropterin synthase [Gemmatimonas sp.]MCA2995322.1 6-carboxytetrahydropterin synthase [Gemmatimonas sp.]MCE2953129.1 6-carboxytetrahydropterin synthase [Gemmatimonas sp.]